MKASKERFPMKMFSHSFMILFVWPLYGASVVALGLPVETYRFFLIVFYCLFEPLSEFAVLTIRFNGWLKGSIQLEAWRLKKHKDRLDSTQSCCYQEKKSNCT